MATSVVAALRIIPSMSHKQIVSKKLCVVNVTQVRGSQYSPIFIEPTLDREELTKPIDDLDERKFRPIKAAKSHETTSLFYDPLVQKFINTMMKGGNKQTVTDIMNRTLENIKMAQLQKYHNASEEEKADIECNPSQIFHEAIENCKPLLILIRIPKGGVMYRVPVPCPENYQRYRAMKWMIESCRDKTRRIPMQDKLSREILDAYYSEGKTIRKKQELHRQCEANKAYAHFRW